MTFLSTENKILLGFGIGAIILMLVGVAAYVNITGGTRTWQDVGRIGNTLTRLEFLAASIREAENVQRGYIITGREYYLNDFERSATNTQAALLVLRSSTGFHTITPRELDSLSRLVSARLDFAGETIRVRRASGFTSAQAMIMTDRGLRMSKAIEEFIAILGQREHESLEEATMRAQESNRMTIPIILFSSAIAVAVLCLAIIIIRQDIRKRRVLEQELGDRAVELQRSNDDLERFAYVASHDLKEPLRMISSFTQLLERKYRGAFDAEGKEFTQYILDGCKRLQRLIDDLLSYSKLGKSGNPFALVHCNAVVQEILTNLRVMITEQNATVTVGSLPSVYGDVVQIGQVFQNLIVNGIKFRGNESPAVRIAGWKDNDDAVFSVTDNGIGIDPAHTGNLFTLFYRLHRNEEFPGTGIGLAVCKRIVERHRGRMWVESTPGKGSTFYFTMPDLKER